MKIRKLITLLLALSCGAATSATAATIVSYLDGSAFTVTSKQASATSYDASVTASSLACNNTNGNFSTASSTFYIGVSYVPATGNTTYLSFDVKNNAGSETLNLTGLSFSIGGSRSTGTGAGSYTVSYNVLYSYDNFATAGVSLGSGSGSLDISVNGDLYYINPASLNLSSLGGLAAEDKIYFRIILNDNSSDNNYSLRLTNLSLTGTNAPIPEPSTYAAILGLAVVAIVCLRRRRA